MNSSSTNPGSSEVAALRPLRSQRDPARATRPSRSREQNSDSLATNDGSSIPRALRLSSFERNFTVETFIGDLSDKVIASSSSQTGALDPKPFLETFEPALEHLLSLRKQVTAKTAELQDEVKVAEDSCNRRFKDLDGGFETIGTSFTALESKITGVGQTAVRIGEQMESLHNLRSLAQSTSLILSYYLSLSQSSTTKTNSDGKPASESSTSSPLEALFATRTSREGRARLAIILRRLSTLAKDVLENAVVANKNAEDQRRTSEDSKRINKTRADVDKAEAMRSEVEKYAERFETECLRLFDKSYRKGDVRMMAHCARILQDFNNGTSCIQMYVNQHDFFISKDKVLEEALGLGTSKSQDVWASINNADMTPPSAEPGLATLAKEIRTTVEQEAQIIQAVFPAKEEVMKVFLQRVFAQVVS